MHTLWKEILTEQSNLLPDFNDFLLLEFRKNKINQIRQYLDELFDECVRMFGGRLKYIGSEEMTPDEKLQYITTNKIIKKQVQIQESTFDLVKFKFEFDGTIYPVHIYVPYLKDGAVIYQGTKYYPLFPIIERGGIHRRLNGLVVKVPRAVLAFNRKQVCEFTTTNGITYRDTIITAKIHQRKTKKKTELPPIVLYHLVKRPFTDVAMMYGFVPGTLSFVNYCDDSDPNNQYVMIKSGIYLKVDNESLKDTFKIRFIGSLMQIFKKYPRFELRDLMASDSHYYITALGRFTYPEAGNGVLLYDNAKKHIETTDTLLSLSSKRQLAQTGIIANDIYELLHIIFYNMDKWIVGYDPLDLYKKKIGSLDQIMAKLIYDIHVRLFKLINNKKEGLKPSTVNDFTKSISLPPSWITRNNVFRANPSICNDNWLMGIGAHKFRSLENTELGNTNKSSHRVPQALLKSHPSMIAVESILCLPPSNVIVAGLINPYLQIDADGNIIEPSWSKEIEHVFD